MTSTPGWVIRKMKEGDRAAWGRLRFQLWDDLPMGDHLVDIDRMFASATRGGYMALVSDTPVGFAERSIRDYANGCTSQPVAFLEGIWVESQFRRRGIGRALIESIVVDLLGDGFRELCSDASITNRRSHSAHKSWGFSETDRVVYFRRPLPPPSASTDLP